MTTTTTTTLDSLLSHSRRALEHAFRLHEIGMPRTAYYSAENALYLAQAAHTLDKYRTDPLLLIAECERMIQRCTK